MPINDPTDMGLSVRQDDSLKPHIDLQTNWTKEEGERVGTALTWLWNITNPRRTDDDGDDADAMVTALLYASASLPAQAVIDAIGEWPSQVDGNYWPTAHALIKLARDYVKPDMMPYQIEERFEPSAQERTRVASAFGEMRAWFEDQKPKERQPIRANPLRDQDLMRARVAAGTAGYFYSREQLRSVQPPDPIRESTVVPDADDWEGDLIDGTKDETASENQADVSED